MAHCDIFTQMPKTTHFSLFKLLGKLSITYRGCKQKYDIQPLVFHCCQHLATIQPWLFTFSHLWLRFSPWFSLFRILGNYSVLGVPLFPTVGYYLALGLYSAGDSRHIPMRYLMKVDFPTLYGPTTNIMGFDSKSMSSYLKVNAR